MNNNSIQLRVARCSDCSLNADTSKYGYFLSVNNCNDSGKGYNICDVTINNRNSRYECKQVNSISDCIDRLTYCENPTFIDPNNTDLIAFCNSVLEEGETHKALGDFYIQDGHILWNLQMEISKCGSSRTALFDSNGNSFPTDQEPSCLPYSSVYMENKPQVEQVMKCPNGEITMMEKVCNADNTGNCTPKTGNDECCVSNSNCNNSVIGCKNLKDKGFKLCSENPNLKQCGNPCATIISIPPLENGSKDEMWQEEICEFFCPSFPQQFFWFGDPEPDEDYEDIKNNSSDRYKSLICSEQYFNLCRLAGCKIDQKCENIWAENSSNQSTQLGRLYPPQYPTVYEINN